MAYQVKGLVECRSVWWSPRLTVKSSIIVTRKKSPHLDFFFKAFLTWLRFLVFFFSLIYLTFSISIQCTLTWAHLAHSLGYSLTLPDSKIINLCNWTFWMVPTVINEWMQDLACHSWLMATNKCSIFYLPPFFLLLSDSSKAISHQPSNKPMVSHSNELWSFNAITCH